MKFYISSISSWMEWRTLITHPILEMAYGGKMYLLKEGTDTFPHARRHSKIYLLKEGTDTFPHARRHSKMYLLKEGTDTFPHVI